MSSISERTRASRHGFALLKQFDFRAILTIMVAVLAARFLAIYGGSDDSAFGAGP